MDITTLVQAVQSLNSSDAFLDALSVRHWQILGPYLARYEVRAGDRLIRQGDTDRCAYLLERGNLQVFVSGGPPGTQRIMILRPGSLVGEPGLFAAVPRSADVEAMTPCVVWALALSRLDELCSHAPAVALQFVRAAGAVMAVRAMQNLQSGQPLA